MAMNCKQFKHTNRVDTKQQYSFNPTEIDYEQSSLKKIEKYELRNWSNKRLLKWFVIAVITMTIVIILS
ncbi:MAG: hypothetical protein ABFR62_00815 [Bacteroidota bacterium]